MAACRVAIRLLLVLAITFCCKAGHSRSPRDNLRSKQRKAASIFCSECEEEFPLDDPDSPTPAPVASSGGDGQPSANREKGSWNHTQASNGMDVLVAAFFLIAACWLFLALIYSLLVCSIVRLRARGELDIYDEHFGRIYMLGRRCYIPFGCVLRRYVIAMEQRDRGDDFDGVSSGGVRLMTREERRIAMERLLKPQEEPMLDLLKSSSELDETAATVEDRSDSDRSLSSGDDVEGSSAEPVCTICLTEYEDSDICFSATTCPHRYHRDCILDWLERCANTECPCCRVPMVSDDEVWETVQQLRRERRKQLRAENRGGFFFWRSGPAEDINDTEVSGASTDTARDGEIDPVAVIGGVSSTQ